MRRRTVLSAALAAAALAALAACTPAAPAASSAPPSPSAPSVAPTETAAPAAAAVAISTEHITVLDPSGETLAGFDYFQPTAEVVAGLSVYLGAPVDTPNPGGIETPPGTDHVWGGLRLFDTETDPPGIPEENPNHYVFVTEATAGPLPISTAPGVGAAEGVRVGDPASLMTIGVETGSAYTDPSTGEQVVVSRLDIVHLDTRPESPEERNFAVAVISRGEDGLIERMIAPSANFGV
ncbi:hypothetical protein ACWKWP_03435 [Agromyces soli]